MTSQVFRAILFLLIASTLSLKALAQSGGTIVIGTDTTFSGYIDAVSHTPAAYCPFGNYYRFNRSQSLYTAAELNAGSAGPKRILSVGYTIQRVSIGSEDLPNFEVYIAHISLDNLVGLNGAFIPMVDSVKVYERATQRFSRGLNTLVFDSAFQYNGRDGILIEIRWGSPQYQRVPLADMYYNFKTNAFPIRRTHYGYSETSMPTTPNLFFPQGAYSNIVLEYDRVTSARRDVSKSAKLAVYPNPATSGTDLQFITAGIDPNETIDILTIEGRLMWQGKAHETLPVRGWAPGMYVVRSRTQSTRLVVQ